jgi:hypothetical protein
MGMMFTKFTTNFNTFFMRKVIFTLFFASLALLKVQAQIATGDAKGNNSIVLANSNVGIDIAESEIKFNWTNYAAETYRKKMTRFWGFSASGKSEEGIAPIFGDGSVTPGAKIQGFFAIKVMSDSRLYDLIEAKKQVRENDSLVLAMYKKYTNYKKAIIEVLDKFAAQYPQDPLFASYSSSKEFKELVLKIQNDCTCKGDVLVKQLNTQKKKYDDNSKSLEVDIYNAIIERIKEYDSQAKNYEASIDKIIEKLKFINNTMDSFTIKSKNKIRYKGGHIIFYVLGGMNATAFKEYDAAIISTNLNNRFPERKFRGGFIDFGVNREFSPTAVGGLSIGFEKANTFDSLSKRNYTVRSSETQGTQTLITEKQHAGYSGFYAIYNRINIKSDFIKYYNLSEEFDIAWNMFYTRLYLPITDKEIKSVVNIGSGVNFFKKKGQFAGGVYLQSNDLFNKVSNASFFKRIQLSLVATFTFQSIVDRFAKGD